MKTVVDKKAEGPRAWCWGHIWLMLAALAGWAGLSAMNAWMGELNQDEGWYLYAAKLVTQGQMPYRDFAFTQAPALPMVYSLFYGWIDRFGVLGGRMLTWAFGALGMLAAVRMAMRSGPKSAQRLTGGLCFFLVALNLTQSYFTVIVKTYALASMFLCAGLAVLSKVHRTHGCRAALLSGFLLACATATRISLGVALALGGLYLLICHRRVRPWAWLDFALGGTLGLALTILPFWMAGGEGFRFGVLEYHTFRDAGTAFAQMAYKIGCLSRLTQAYYPAAMGALGLLIAAGYHLVRRGNPMEGTAPVKSEPQAEDVAPAFTVFLWVTSAALALVHLSAPFPYDDYFVPIYPVFCAALSATGIRWWLRMEQRRFGTCSRRSRASRRLAILALTGLLCAAHVFSSPLAQAWFVAGRDRIWWRLRDQSPIAQLRDTAQWVRELTLADGGTQLLTQDTYLAVEARLPVPHGMEMGPFSYYPDWPRDRAERLGVMNRDQMLECLAGSTNTPIAAFSGYGLTIRSPEVLEVSREDGRAFQKTLEAHFDRVETIPAFGQAATPLVLWRLRNPALEENPVAPPDAESAEPAPSAEEAAAGLLTELEDDGTDLFTYNEGEEPPPSVPAAKDEAVP